MNCTYPTCTCIVQTSTSQPQPDCGKGLEDYPLRWESVPDKQPSEAQRSLTVPGLVVLVRRTLDKTKSNYVVVINGKPHGSAETMEEGKVKAARRAAAKLEGAVK